MQLGCFSVSLSVKDLQASIDFYQKLGFEIFHDACDQHWCIMKNGQTNIGLFEGMFEGNILTFNPGRDQDAKPVDEFTDVREIEKKLKDDGVKLERESEGEEGPTSIVMFDPDGNVVMVDQHV